MKDEIIDSLLALLVSVECYIDQFESIIRYKASTNLKAVSLESLLKFRNDLSQKRPDLIEQFENNFLTTEVSSFFLTYPEYIKEISHVSGKNIRFEIEGSEIKVPDKRFDEIFSAFIHFIRNSLEHGIETKEERISKQKDPCGMIRFQFQQSHDKLLVCIKDDGRGIDWRSLNKKLGIQNEEEAIDYILQGKVSTKETVTIMSGRGIGVSAIYTLVLAAQGNMSLENSTGHGLKIKIVLPMLRPFVIDKKSA